MKITYNAVLNERAIGDLSFLEDRPRTYAMFCNDTLFRRGVEHNIEIMGEAMNCVLKTIPNIPITSARKIVDTRNLIIHACDSTAARHSVEYRD